MSAADTFAKYGAGARNLAIGAAVVAALVAVVWVVKKLKPLGEAAAEAGGFLFGADAAPSTLGTWIYDSLHNPAAAFDEAQAIATCNVIWRQKGALTGPICQKLRAEGKLSPP